MTTKLYNTQVACLQTFHGSNLYAVNLAGNKLYVVYSYGPHWPLFVFDREDRRWFRNEDKYSQTTTQHASKTVPHGVITEPVSCKWLISYIDTVQADMPLPLSLPSSLALARHAPITPSTPHI